MEKNQKIIIILLILAIIFSIISIVISFGVSNMDLSQFNKPTYIYKIQNKDTGFGSVGLTVERSERG